MWQGWCLHWAALKRSIKTLSNKACLGSVIPTFVTHIDIWRLNKFIFLVGGYSWNTHLSGRICRGAFRPSAFLINLTWDFMAWTREQGHSCDIYSSSEDTGWGAELPCMHPSRKLHLAGLFWLQGPGQCVSVPAPAQCCRLSADRVEHYISMLIHRAEVSDAGLAGGSWCCAMSARHMSWWHIMSKTVGIAIIRCKFG